MNTEIADVALCDRASPSALLKPSLKERQWLMREAAIIEAARDLLAVKGFANMTLDEVVAEVGISKPTFYLHFTSKEELGVRVLVHAMSEAEAHLATLAAALPPREAAVRMIGWTFDRLFGEDGHYDFSGALCLFGLEAVRAAEARCAAAFAAVVEQAREEGTIRGSASPQLIAQALHSILKDAAYEHAFKTGRLDVESLKADVSRLLLG